MKQLEMILTMILQSNWNILFTFKTEFYFYFIFEISVHTEAGPSRESLLKPTMAPKRCFVIASSGIRRV